MMKIDKLLAPTAKLFEAIEIYQLDMQLKPETAHYACHIKLLDFKFNKAHLILRLREAIVRWVFTKGAAERIFQETFGEEEDLGAASTSVYTAARETMRLSAPQGQFGELLLSAFLQHLFKAVPLLRKQPVRTSDNHERFGADAIHYSGGPPPKIYLGESKCYKSKYKFAQAFKESVESIWTTISSFESEIKKFRVGGFIEEELRQVASDVLQNKVAGLEIHPVCIIIYNETDQLKGEGSAARAEEIKKIVMGRCANLPTDAFDGIDPSALKRFIYIIFPVWDLDVLLNEFVEAL